MKLDEAITTAIDYEGKVHKTYLEAMEKATDEIGKRVFKTLCDEEKGHLIYLRKRLDEWKKDGKINPENLGTAIPTRDAIAEGVAKLKEKVETKQGADYGTELEMLRRALAVEIEASNFYKDMVGKMDGDGQKMFARFVEIEEGHQAIVQAEIDSVSGMGFWFDSREFSLEMG